MTTCTSDEEIFNSITIRCHARWDGLVAGGKRVLRSTSESQAAMLHPRQRAGVQLAEQLSPPRLPQLRSVER